MKTETKHTQGPWFVEPSYSQFEGNFTGVWAHAKAPCKFNTRIAKIHDYEGKTEANAHLIAAAPELLKELKRASLIIEALVDNHYGTSLHHIGDGDGFSTHEADELRRWIKSAPDKVAIAKADNNP